jgi:very-short-patch-repair endonuclease
MSTKQILAKYRSSLLDLTLKNRLLNFKPNSKSVIRIIDEDPANIIGRLLLQKKLELAPIPEPQFTEEETSGLEQGEKPVKPSVIEYAKRLGIDPSYDLSAHINSKKPAHTDSYLQTLQYPEDLERNCGKVFGQYRTGLEETGNNLLYLTFLTLVYYPVDDAETPSFAPIITLQVELERQQPDRGHSWYRFLLKAPDVEPEVNISLLEKLKADYSIVLPEFNIADASDIGAELLKYKAELEQTLKATKPKWRVNIDVNLAILNFAKLVIYRDLAPETWEKKGKSVTEHPLVSQLCVGNSTFEKTDIVFSNEEYDIDRLGNNEYFEVIYDADSSQHNAILDVCKGKNLVIEGPPGTGKSQTITNIIAAVLSQGKRVLFLSEKLAALKVVKDRLDQAGLGDFCLELHSTKSNKKTVLNEISKRKALKAERSQNPLRDERQRQELKEMLNSYSEELHNKSHSGGKSIFDWIGEAIRLENEVTGFCPDVEIINNNVELPAVAPSAFEAFLFESRPYLDALTELLGVSGADDSPWNKVSIKEVQVSSATNVFREIQNLTELVRGANESIEATFPESAERLRQLTIPDLVSFLNWLLTSEALLSPSLRGAFLSLLRMESSKRQLVLGRVGQLKEEVAHLKTLGVYELLFDADVEKFVKDLKVLLESFPALENKAWDVACRDFDRVSERSGVFKKFAAAYESEKHTLKIPGSLPLVSFIDLIKDGEQLRELATKDFSGLDAFHELKKVLRIELISGVQQRISKISALAKEVYCRFNTKFESGQADLALTRIKVLEETSWVKRLFFKEHKDAYQWYRSLIVPGSRLAVEDAIPYLNQGFEMISEVAGLLKMAPSLSSLVSENTRPDWERLADTFLQAKQIYSRLKSHQIDSDAWFQEVLKESGDLTLFTPVEGQSASKILKNLQEDVGSILEGSLTLLDFERAYHSVQTYVGAGSEVLGNLKFAKLFTEQATKVVFSRVILTRNTRRFYEDCRVLLEPLGVHEVIRNPNNFNDFENIKLEISNVTNLFSDEKFVPIFSQKPYLEEILEDPSTTRGLRQSFQNVCERISGGSFEIEGFPEMNLGSGLRFLEHCVNSEASFERYFELAKLEIPLKQNESFSSIRTAGLIFRERRLAERYLKYRVVKSYSSKILSQASASTKLSGEEWGELRKAFAVLDQRAIIQNRERIINRLLEVPVPKGNGYGPRSSWTQDSLLNNEVNKEKRHIAIRQLIERTSDALLALKPCFMMSPLSVAQFLTPGAVEFDLVIMDEASQLRSEEAIGAISRGKQLVVVGDTKQMPPSSFFDQAVTTGVDNELQEEVFESILEQAAGVFHPARRLKWHYRSQHQSLIAFSNSKFYNNDLIIFPTNKDNHPFYGVKFNLISNGVYQGSGANLVEAQALVQKLKEHVVSDPTSSVAIVTMNINQKEIIEDLILQESKNDPALSAFINGLNPNIDPILIQNLENVQGHERDVVFISVTYGPDPSGVFHHRFGPINLPNGQRRLNVLFSRAKKRMEVLCSFDPSKLSGAKNEGAQTLYGFLKFAQTGQLPSEVIITNKPADSPFEVDVAEQVRRLGYQVEPQLGVAGYFLDLAVRCPHNLNEFLLGIECDGATYHSAKTARDRDRLREDNLKKLGWSLYRIWSTNWFRDRKTELKKLEAHLKEAARRRVA